MKNRAFVRYSKQGKIVPGSLILTGGTYPNGPSTWKEVPADLCGGPVVTTSVMATFPVASSGFSVSLSALATADGVSISLEKPAATIEAMVKLLNYYGGWMGTWKVNPNGTDIDLYPSSQIAKGIAGICDGTSVLVTGNI